MSTEYKDKFQKVFNADYPGIDKFISEVIEPIFGDNIDRMNKEILDEPEYRQAAERAHIIDMKCVAEIENIESDKIYLYDVTVDNSARLGQLRVAIQQLIRRITIHFSHILMVFHHENPTDKEWRFSYAYKESTIAGMTSAKRFTYIFGKEYRSRTAAERFDVLRKSDKTDSDFKEAFSVQKLSDEFFNLYRAYYAMFVEFITRERYSAEKELLKYTEKAWSEWKQTDESNQFSSSFDGDAKTVRDYIKKMFGRIVFLYFIQRKGWLYDNDGNSDYRYLHNLFDNCPCKDNFLDGCLETLFFRILDTDKRLRQPDILAYPGGRYIPYLNGGLFEETELDSKTCVFPAAYFEHLFQFLDSYNFTIDENDPDDAEIGIDPEMLGRIFENLLEDNKDKGAFYTPKEIVDYMCRESVIAYLQNGYNDEDQEKIRHFVETLDGDNLSKELKYEIQKHLVDVKVCDPAIGSGAFPMGIVNLLCKIFTVLRFDGNLDRSKMKRHILENNIYGVDIEEGAVDIARLRFWLSMVVDEHLEKGQEPPTLPNLHFKIMQGNSLLESYKGHDLSNLLTGTDSKGQATLDFGDRRALLNKDIREYYNEDNHDKRNKLLTSIKNQITSEIFDRTQDQTLLSNIKDVSANDKFFLWHTWFADVFENGGFDIVIGNPPYIQLQKSIEIKITDKHGREYELKLGDLYEHEGFKTFAKTGDIYCLFYEQGWRLLKNGGQLCYITSNKWMRAGYGEKLRLFFASKTNPEILIDFAGVRIFENATVDTNILLFSKEKNEGRTKVAIINKGDYDSSFKLSDYMRQNTTEMSFKSSDSWVILSPIEQSIKRKIESVGVPLKEWNITINYGIKTGCNEAFVITTKKRDEILACCANEIERKRTDALIRPILRGRDIKRYAYNWDDLWLINAHNGIKGEVERVHIEDYPAVKAHLDKYWDKISTRTDKGDTPYNLRSCAYLDDFSKPKIAWGNLNLKGSYSYVPEGVYINAPSPFIASSDIALLHILNSKVADYYIRSLGVTRNGGYFEYKPMFVEKFPIPKKGLEYLNQYPLQPTINQEFVINKYIYELFGLTNEEIEFIETQ